MKKFDFIAIGDIVTDAFIRISAAEVEEHNHHEELCIAYGAKIPYDSVTVIPAVGNCANAAVAAARLGLSAGLVANQGADDVGESHLTRLAEEGVARDFIGVHAGMKTNYHYVLWFKEDRTILVKHEEYPLALPDIGSPTWVYLTSLGSQSAAYHKEIERYLQEHPEISLAFQPGTFQIKLGTGVLAGIYARTQIFFCNIEEAQTIIGSESNDPLQLARGIAALGPKIVCLTDGPRGAFAYDTSADELFTVPAYPDIRPPLERTGAGDAFASSVTIALALGKPLAEALLWGPINSMSVVQDIGAQAGLLTREKLEHYLSLAPASYRITSNKE